MDHSVIKEKKRHYRINNKSEEHITAPPPQSFHSCAPWGQTGTFLPTGREKKKNECGSTHKHLATKGRPCFQNLPCGSTGSENPRRHQGLGRREASAAITALVPVNIRFLGEPWREQIHPPGLHSADSGGGGGGTHGNVGWKDQFRSRERDERRQMPEKMGNVLEIDMSQR